MYVPSAFALDDAAAREVLREVGAADLVTPTATGLVTTFLPLLLEGDSLIGHVARGNPHWKAVPTGESLVIVRGGDGYVTPQWYATKAATGEVVPTWNYVAVHVHGALIVHDDAAWVGGIVRKLTDHHEGKTAAPWSVDDAPAEFIAKLHHAIVGIELTISRIEGKAKLSQNRSAADVDGVIAGLRARGDEAGAAAVERARRR